MFFISEENLGEIEYPIPRCQGKTSLLNRNNKMNGGKRGNKVACAQVIFLI